MDNKMTWRFQQTAWAYTRQIRSVAAVMLLAAFASGHADATTIATCEPSKVKVVAQTINTNRTTTSDVFADVPATDTKIVQGGNANSCVIVDFSAMVNTGASA